MAKDLRYLSTATLSGALFGIGLYVSQMVDPSKVLAFLDFTAITTGDWDPSLLFVMGPAVGIMLAAVAFGRSRGQPLFDTRFHEPATSRIDQPLIGGAVLFGIGWGMSGLCPGPALALIAFAPHNLWLFLAAMCMGSWGGRVLLNRAGWGKPVAAT